MAWKTLWSQAKGGFVAARSDRWCNSRWLVLGIVIGTVAALVAPVILADRGELETGELVIMSGRDDSAGGQRQALIDQWNGGGLTVEGMPELPPECSTMPRPLAPYANGTPSRIA